MNSQVAIKYLQDYYGSQYNPAKREACIEYLDRFEPDQRPILIQKVLRTFSDRWGKVPGIAELENAFKALTNLKHPEYDEAQSKVFTVISARAKALPIPERPQITAGSEGKELSQEDISKFWENISK